MSARNATQPSRIPTWVPLLALAVAVIAMWVGWALYGVQLVHQRLGMTGGTLAEFGQVGDLFGGVNALFAALALIGVIWAGSLQRQALIEARAALAEDRAQQDRQQFETTFFHVLTLFRELLASLDLQRVSGPTYSLTLDAAVRHVLGDREMHQRFYSSNETAAQALTWHLEYSRDFLRSNGTQLAPLFGTLTELLRHVDESATKRPHENKRYVGLIAAQLNEPLLLLLALYAADRQEAPLFDFIKRFALLKPLAHDHYMRPILGSAFGEDTFGVGS